MSTGREERPTASIAIPAITLEHAGASAVILADARDESSDDPEYEGIASAVAAPRVDLRIFGKPSTRPYRRMGVALAFDNPTTSIDILRARAREAASKVKVNP